jgi:hypothetical protein
MGVPVDRQIAWQTLEWRHLDSLRAINVEAFAA